MHFVLQYIILSFQEPSASYPCVPVLLASTSSFPVTHGTCTACLMTLAMATDGPCSVHGEALASPSLLASFAPWLPPFSQYPGPPAPSPDRRTALSAKAYGHKKTDCKHRWTTNKKTVPCRHLFTHLPSPVYNLFSCVCVKKWVS